MWKCASRTIRATFNKSISKCNTVLSTKARQKNDVNDLLKLTPVLIERLNRHYGFYKSSCGDFNKQKRDKEGPRKKKGSFLGGFNHDVFDALGWSGVIVIGYYLIQPFTFKRLSNYDPHDNQHCLAGYQRTLQNLISVGIKPFNCVLPEVQAAKTRKSKTKEFTESEGSNLKPELGFSSLEKAHQKVLGSLSNWIGTQCMQSGKCKEALEYFKQAAEEESPAGIFNLGICHERGLGTSQNFKMAAELYQRAADLGHATAMYNLGIFYAQGLGGVEPDVDHARELFKAAASLGQADAKKALTLEQESRGESPKSPSPEPEPIEKKYKISIGQLICDTLLHQASVNPLDYCNVFAGGVKNPSCDSYQCLEEKNLNLTTSSDSGILDLSPPNDSDVLLQV